MIRFFLFSYVPLKCASPLSLLVDYVMEMSWTESTGGHCDATFCRVPEEGWGPP